LEEAQVKDWTTIAIGTFLALMAFVASAHATPVAVQEERYITCGSPEERQIALEVVKDFGATRVRINAMERWLTDPTQCDPIASALAVHAAGLEPQVTIVGDAQYAAQVVDRLGPIVRFWSVWNEPNLKQWHYGPMASGHPRDYRRLWQRVAGVIRQRDPGARVLFGELPPVGTAIPAYLRSALTGSRVRTEGLAIHPYPHALNYKRNYGTGKQPYPGQLKKHLKDLRVLLKGLAKKKKLCQPGPGCRPVPLYITEFGGTGVDLHRYWRAAQKAGVRQLFHYQLIQGDQAWWDTALVDTDGARRDQWHTLRGFK
jgi:hypothetical protein